MRCQEARAAVSRALDGEPDSLEALRHGVLCAACSAWAREVHGVDEALHDAIGEVEEAPEGFAERLMSRLPEESPLELAARREARGAGDTVGWLVAVAALVAVFEWGGTLGGTAGVLERARPLLSEGWLTLRAIPGALEAWVRGLSLSGEVPGIPSAEPGALLLALAVATALQWAAGLGLRSGEAQDA